MKQEDFPLQAFEVDATDENPMDEHPMDENPMGDDNQEREETSELDGESDGIADDSEEKVQLIANAADSLKAEEISVLDLRGLTIIADFFLICTGKSSIHIRSITDRIEERMRDEGFRKLRMEGYQEATWILLDYGDVVVHVMAAEQRAFYNLEAFWNQAPRVGLELILKPSEPILM